MSSNESFACAKEAYTFMRDKQALNLPDVFEALTQGQQDFFIDFFEACKEIEYETAQQKAEECTDSFLEEVKDQFGHVGETTIENILYNGNMKVVRDY